MSQHFLQLTVSQQTLGQHSTGRLLNHQTAALWGVMQLCAHRSGTVHLHEADSPPSHHPHHAGFAQDTFMKRLTTVTPSTSRRFCTGHLHEADSPSSHHPRQAGRKGISPCSLCLMQNKGISPCSLRLMQNKGLVTQAGKGFHLVHYV